MSLVVATLSGPALVGCRSSTWDYAKGGSNQSRGVAAFVAKRYPGAAAAMMSGSILCRLPAGRAWPPGPAT